MVKRKKSYRKARTYNPFSSKRKSSRHHFSGGKVKIIQPEMIGYGLVRDKIAAYIPNYNILGLPDGSSDILILATAGYFASKQKGLFKNIGHAILSGENYEAGKTAGVMLLGNVSKTQSGSTQNISDINMLG